MINTYSGALIALQVNGRTDGKHPYIEVLAEEADGTKGGHNEYRIAFRGRLAKDARESLVPGVAFTYRGTVETTSSGETVLEAKAFTAIE